jgi:hypothetical protein
VSTDINTTRQRRRNPKLPGTKVTMADMSALAIRLETGCAADTDLHLAGRLVLALLHMMPADSTLHLPQRGNP